MYPAHGNWCNTKTKPINCRYCGKRIFFFSCDHGSKVYFDELGRDWPLHRCSEYLTARYGRNFLQQVAGQYLPTEMHSIRPNLNLRLWNPNRVIPRLPMEGADIRVSGIVREREDDINLFKLFNVDKSAAGAALLGEIAKRKYGIFQIWSATSDFKVVSYTFFIRQDTIQQTEPEMDDFVTVRLITVPTPMGKPAWLGSLIALEPLEG